MVYDQDSIIVVSENSGDIIHTQAFAVFLAETKLEVRVCRKSDPESKGLVESSVKFIKRNYMENRYFMGIDIWNESFEEWLIRTGNGKTHGTTKRKPAEMFEEEQEYLLPLFGVAPGTITEEMNRTVRADNTILYHSNRYSLPLGTHGKMKSVYLMVEGETLQIMDQIGEPLATHQICKEKGKLIKQASHRRDKATRIKEQLEKAVALLGEEFREYLTALIEEKPRYVREQLDIVIHACEGYGREHVLEAMRYCQELGLNSANDLNDAVSSMYGQPLKQPQPERLPVDDERYHMNVQKRSLSVYTEVALGSMVEQ
jgi:hypothetical protein